jgi:hypothetical protein
MYRDICEDFDQYAQLLSTCSQAEPEGTAGLSHVWLYNTCNLFTDFAYTLVVYVCTVHTNQKACFFLLLF